MKKALILAYDFPPYVSVGGLRPYAWYNYFYEFGLYPVVVTRQWGNKYGNHLDYIAPGESNETIIEESEIGTIIRTPYKPNLANRLLLKYGEDKFRLLRKAISGFYEFTQFLLPVGTKAGLYKGAKTYLKQNKVDVIIATGEPFVLFKYANKLSKKHDIPWIADYRDPWNPKNTQNKIWQFFQVCFEKKYVATANKGIAVSDFCKNKTKQIVRDTEFIILPNGYNPDFVLNIEGIEQNNKILGFAFVGTIQNWDPYKSVLLCFNEFLKNNPDKKIKLDFYGINKEREVLNFVTDKCNLLNSCVTIFPKTPTNDLLKKLSTYNVLLLLNYYSFTGTKIYDYLAEKRFILLCYSNDNEALALKEKYYPQKETEGLSTHLQEDIISETKSGIVARDYNHLSQILENLYAEFQAKGKIECNSVNIEYFSRKHQVKKLATLINEIT